MKKLILMATVLLTLFAISAGSSYFLRHNKTAPEEHAETPEPGAGKGHKGQEKPGVAASSPAELRPAVRPAFNQEADNAGQLVNNLRTQTEALRTREQQLIARQKNMELIFQDIKGERAVIDDLRKQASEELKAIAEKIAFLEKKAGDVDNKSNQLKDQKKQMTESQLRVDESEKESIKRLAVVYDTMDPEAAAQHLQHLADTGKMDTAVKILAAMRERSAAKVLAQFPDQVTVGQLLEKMRSVDRSRTPGKADDDLLPPGGPKN